MNQHHVTRSWPTKYLLTAIYHMCKSQFEMARVKIFGISLNVGGQKDCALSFSSPKSSTDKNSLTLVLFSFSYTTMYCYTRGAWHHYLKESTNNNNHVCPCQLVTHTTCASSLDECFVDLVFSILYKKVRQDTYVIYSTRKNSSYGST